MRIYFIRHQAAGVLTKYPFAQYPTEAQIEAVKRECFQAYGAFHPKAEQVLHPETGEVLEERPREYWMQVVEAQALTADDVIDVPDRALSLQVIGGIKASAPNMVASGVGFVRNPGD